MEQNVQDKIDLKQKILTFYNYNKKKIYFFILILFIIIISIIFYKYNSEQKNILIAEKYIQAGIQLSSNKNDDAKKLFEEIILSKNEFYSILSLNTIIEKNLINDKNKILKYFTILEKSITSKEQVDLIIFKKALYLIKVSDIQKGKNLLKQLVDKNSNLKSIAQEILNK
tara:strand:- start:41 stop:550 length:510 start_codon:yes stop_codon:yes gene_type:complete